MRLVREGYRPLALHNSLQGSGISEKAPTLSAKEPRGKSPQQVPEGQNTIKWCILARAEVDVRHAAKINCEMSPEQRRRATGLPIASPGQDRVGYS